MASPSSWGPAKEVYGGLPRRDRASPIGGILFAYIGAYFFVMVGAVAGAVIGGKRGGFVSGLWYFFIGAFAAGFVVNTVAYSLGEVLVGIAVVIVCALFGGMAGSIRGAMHRVTGKP